MKLSLEYAECRSTFFYLLFVIITDVFSVWVINIINELATQIPKPLLTQLALIYVINFVPVGLKTLKTAIATTFHEWIQV